jgi:KipI family sensor histidine kinase inhibitor
MPPSNHARSPSRTSKETFRIVPLGDSAITIEFGNEIDPLINARTIAFAKTVVDHEWFGILDVVPAYRSVTVFFDPLQWSSSALTKKLRALPRPRPNETGSNGTVQEIPVLYGGEWGPDLEKVAGFAGLTPAQAIELHASTRYRVYMLGFSPGFPYLGLVHEPLAMPRLSTPRTKVPAGSVGIADRQTGIYPSATPGGWRLIGRTPIAIYHKSRIDPFLLKPGDLVQFRPINQNEFDRLLVRPSMTTIDLNSDMGEYESEESLALEAQLMPLITSVNIACGAHAGHPDLMRRTARLAAQYGTAIGAHPGFPNVQDFGRQDRSTSPEEVESLVSTQLKTLAEVLASEDLMLTHIKLHGALYNLAARDHAVADAVVQAVASFDPRLLLFALSGSALAVRGQYAGLTVVQEAFADRAYQSDGTLVPRSMSGALLKTEQQVRQQLHEILRGYVTSIDGQRVALRADSLCVHADTPHAIAFVQLVRREIEAAGIYIVKPQHP